MKVSVIVPVYNVAPWLEECLDSALGETGNIEVVCVDDGSTDDSGAILDAYAAKSGGRMKVLHKENGGVSSARNAALKMATGDWIMFLDGDDVLARGWFSVVSGMAERCPSIPVLGFERSITLPLEPVSLGDIRELDTSRRLPLVSFVHDMWQFAYRRSMLDGLEFGPFSHGEDKLFQGQAMLRTDRIALCDAIIYGYRQRAGSAMRSVWGERGFRDDIEWRFVWMDALKASGKDLVWLLRYHMGSCFLNYIPYNALQVKDESLREKEVNIWFDSLKRASKCDFLIAHRIMIKILSVTRSRILMKLIRAGMVLASNFAVFWRKRR